MRWMPGATSTAWHHRSVAERMRLEDLLIVDADVHVHESPRALVPYCDMPWEVALRSCRRARALPRHPRLLARAATAATTRFPTGHEARGWCTRPSRCCEELDEIHVDLGRPLPRPPAQARRAHAGRLCGRARARLQRVAGRPSGRREHRRCSGRSSPARRTPPTPRARSSATPAPGDRRRLPPLRGHRPAVGPPPLRPDLRRRRGRRAAGAAAQRDRHAPGVPVQQPRLRHRAGAAHAQPHVLDHGQRRHMVTTGVPVRFPELRIASPRPASPGCRSSCNRLDKEYLERRRDVPFLTERPEPLRQAHATSPRSRSRSPSACADIATLIDLFDGEDTTIFASDWPHHDFDHPMKLDQVPMTDDQRRKLFGENAAALFNIDAAGDRRVSASVGRGALTSRGHASRGRGRRPRDRRVQHRRARCTGSPNICPTRPGRCARPGRDRHPGATAGRLAGRAGSTTAR